MPDLNQARVNKCLIALVNRKVVQKDSASVSSLSLHVLPDNLVPRSPRELYCTTGEAYPEPLIYQCSWFAAFKPPALGIFCPFKLAIYLYHLGIHRPWKFDLKDFHCLISPQPQQIGVCRSSQFWHYFVKTHQSRS